jgi:hypothetical protein
VLVLDERHQVHVVLASDYEDALARIPLGVRVFKNIEQVAALDVEDASSNPMPRSFLSFAFFASSQAKYFGFKTSRCVPVRHTLASAAMCPRVCPNAARRPSSGSQRQPSSQ